MWTSIDLGAITDPQFNADLDYAAKRYAARVVGELLAKDSDLTASELHRMLVERAEEAQRRASTIGG